MTRDIRDLGVSSKLLNGSILSYLIARFQRVRIQDTNSLILRYWNMGSPRDHRVHTFTQAFQEEVLLHVPYCTIVTVKLLAYSLKCRKNGTEFRFCISEVSSNRCVWFLNTANCSLRKSTLNSNDFNWRQFSKRLESSAILLQRYKWEITENLKIYWAKLNLYDMLWLY